MKFLVSFSRLFVGLLFIFSGLIKINDPVGFSFKLEEYFGPTVFNIDFLLPYVLPLAIFIVVVEVLLGVFLLIGLKKEFTIYSLFVMIVFFTFLTWYSAYFNKVTDCGCFGDAIKLTPWESFTKDIILLVFIIILMMGLKYIKPLFTNKLLYTIPVISLVICILIVNQVLSHLPLIDFRPYKIGNNIIENMITPEDSKKAIFRYDWLFNVEGEKKIISTSGNFPSIEGDFISVETELLEEGYEPPIHDFSMELDDIDYTDSLMQEENLLIFVFYNISKMELEAIGDLKESLSIAMDNNYKIIGLTASGNEDVNNFKSKFLVDLDFYFCDETALRTIVRSNPAALKLHKGTIIQKAHWNDFQSLDLINL